MEPAMSGEEDHMDINERRIILDRGFERALTAVLEAFAHEGFVINPGDAGDLHRHDVACDRLGDRAGDRRRYAVLDATLIDPVAGSVSVARRTRRCACRVSMFELAGACTLVTIADAGASERVHDVIRALLRAGTLNAA
jgi:hypothetical protein